jgi:3-hydroxybutyryl-CoA dehydratase
MLPPTRTLYFEDLSIGLTESYEKEVKSSDVVGFAEITGDRNPIHLSEHFAAKTPFGGRIAHGLYTASLISAVIGTRRPDQAQSTYADLNFKAPVKIGDASCKVEVVSWWKRSLGKTGSAVAGQGDILRWKARHCEGASSRPQSSPSVQDIGNTSCCHLCNYHRIGFHYLSSGVAGMTDYCL